MDHLRQRSSEIPEHIPPARVVDFDYLADPDLKRDPHRVYMRLQGGPELVYTPRHGGHWIATRKETIEEIFHSPEIFSNFPRVIPRGVSGFGGKPQPFSDIDPPHNAPYRRLLQQVLNPRAVKAFEDQARLSMLEILDEVAARGGCEFSADVAQKLPINIIMRWMDLPFDDRFVLMDWVDIVLGQAEPERRRAAKDAIAGYVDRIVVERRLNPGEDVISHLANGRIGDRPVSQEEGRAMVANLVNGGLDTVRNMMGFIAHFLATHPDHRRELVDDPGLIPNAVEELLRWAAIPNMSRSVKADVDFHGVRLKAGDLVLMPLVLAGRDEAAFDDALNVDFRRERLRHLTFGTGAHLCPGMHLARIELQTFLQEWLKRIPHFELAPGAEPVMRGGIILAVRSLPLVWEAA